MRFVALIFSVPGVQIIASGAKWRGKNIPRVLQPVSYFPLAPSPPMFLAALVPLHSTDLDETACSLQLA